MIKPLARLGRIGCALMLLVFGIAPSLAGQDSTADEVRAVVDAFHDALARGDGDGAVELLHPDVTILESGGRESLDEYVSGHLAGDMRFAQAVRRERGPIDVTVMGDVAWAVSTSTVQGRMGEREIDSRSGELMVLSRDGDAWRIRAIHWSSRAARR